MVTSALYFSHVAFIVFVGEMVNINQLFGECFFVSHYSFTHVVPELLAYSALVYGNNSLKGIVIKFYIYCLGIVVKNKAFLLLIYLKLKG